MAAPPRRLVRRRKSTWVQNCSGYSKSTGSKYRQRGDLSDCLAKVSVAVEAADEICTAAAEGSSGAQDRS